MIANCQSPIARRIVERLSDRRSKRLWASLPQRTQRNEQFDLGVLGGVRYAHVKLGRVAVCLAFSIYISQFAIRSPVVYAEVIDRALAVVNGDLITLSDVRGALELGLIAPGSAADPIQGVLSQLIDRALELDEVDRYQPPEPAAEAVDVEVQAVRSRFPSPAAFEAALTHAGMDVQRLRQTVRDNLRIRTYVDQRFLAVEDRRQQLIDDWLAGLRRRGEIVDLYRAGP